MGCGGEILGQISATLAVVNEAGRRRKSTGPAIPARIVLSMNVVLFVTVERSNGWFSKLSKCVGLLFTLFKTNVLTKTTGICVCPSFSLCLAE